MKHSAFLAIVLTILGFALLLLSFNLAEATKELAEPQTQCLSEIEELTYWDSKNFQLIEVWTIRGTQYLVTRSPRGSKEISGKLERFHLLNNLQLQRIRK